MRFARPSSTGSRDWIASSRAASLHCQRFFEWNEKWSGSRGPPLPELGRRRGLGALRRLLLACRRSSFGGLDRLRRRLTLLGRLNPELLVEPLDPALGVDELLSTSEERMA